MKNFRIKLFSLIAVFAISVFGFASFISAKADDPPAQPEHTEAYNATVQQFAALNFKMNGASVRKNTFPGIRFEATLDKTQWDAILTKSNAYSKDSNGSCRINETGLLLIPKDYLKQDQELTVGTRDDKFLIGVSGVMLLPLDPVLDEDEGVYKLKGGISPIDSELYDKQFTARGYIRYTLADNSVEEENNFKYADMVVGENDMSTRSLNTVTTEVLADTNNGLDETEISFVSSIQNRTFSAPEQKVYNVGETIDLSGLNSAATNPYDSYYVSVKGGNYTSVTSPYTFAESGRHKFKLQEASGTSDSFVVDAISPETKYDVFKAEDLLATLKYGGKTEDKWDSLNNSTQKFEEADPDGDGDKEKVFIYSPNHDIAYVDGTIIQGRPVYSKAYYQKLSDDFNQIGVALNLDFSYYFIKDNNESNNFTEYNTFTKHDNVYWSYASDTNYVDHWVTETITLEQFISLYDNLYKGYIWENNNVRSRLVTYKTVTADEDIDYLMNFYHSDGFNLYIREMKLNVPAADLGTVLVDRHTLTEVDLSDNTKLSAAKRLYDNPDLTLVSRYGNKTIAFANDKFTINSDVNSDSYMEDGLYYLKGTKDGEECFTLTVDIYDSTKPVEVESFGHKDSKNAVSVYYIKESAFSVSEGVTSARTYNTQAMFDFRAMSSDDYLKLDFANDAHGLSLGNATLTDKPDDGIMHSSIYGEGNLTDVPCLTIDESKFTTEGPLAIDNRGVGWYDGVGADLYIYVLPRHSKKYYEKYRDDNINNSLGFAYKYGFSYTGGYNNAWYTTSPAPDNTWYAGQFFGYVSGITEDNKISFVNSNMTWYDWAYTDAAIYNLKAKETDRTPVTNLTIDEFINHYDAFASGKVWSYKLFKPSFNPKEKERLMGECATYTAKMFGITFTRKGQTAAPTPTTPAE